MDFTNREIILMIISAFFGIFIGLGVKFALDLLWKMIKKLFKED